MKKLTPKIACEVATHEGMVRQAYKDSVGVWTWSVGITSASGHNVERYIDNPQPMDKCMKVWLWLLEKYADDVREVFKGHRMTNAQFAAALSFHWNTGRIKSASWTRHWKAGNMAAARKAFMSWRKPKAIIPRRRAEAALLFDGVWSGDGRVNVYGRLSSRHTPVWGSVQRVPIMGTVRQILAGDAQEEVEIEHAPSPEPGHKTSEDRNMGLWATIVAGVAAATTGVASWLGGWDWSWLPFF